MVKAFSTLAPLIKDIMDVLKKCRAVDKQLIADAKLMKNLETFVELLAAPDLEPVELAKNIAEHLGISGFRVLLSGVKGAYRDYGHSNWEGMGKEVGMIV